MPLELVVPKIVSTSKGDCGCERWVCAAASLTASTVVPSSRAPSDVDPPKRHTHLPHSGPSSPPKCHSLPATEHLPFIDRAPPTDLSSSTNVGSHPPPPPAFVPSHPCAVLPPPRGEIQFALGGWEEERESMGMGCVGGRCEICMGVRTLLDV
jgi:hypothetical protein